MRKFKVYASPLLTTVPPLDGHCGVIVGNREQAYEHVIHILANAKTEILAFLGAYTLSITTDDEAFKAKRLAAKARGVKLRYITEITKENSQYCKRIMNMVTELRHLDNIAGNFILSDSEIGATPEVSAEKPISYGFYSNLEGVLTLYRGVFETFWNYSIPADVRLSQLESGVNSPSRPPPSTVNKHKETVIDRFYICKRCAWSSAFLEDAIVHEQTTDHREIKELPIFEK